MKNIQDYEAGYTTRIFNPETGKYSSGGAARNLRIKQEGGASQIKVRGFIQGIQHVQPLLESYQQQLAQSQALLSDAMKLLNKQKKSTGK